MRAIGGSARRWRTRPWPNDPGVVHMIPSDHLAIPTEAELLDLLERVRQPGVRAVRTAALFERAAEVATAVGFEPIDRLALMKRDLNAIDRLTRPSDLAVVPMRRWHHQRAAVVDQAAFGKIWGNDATSLGEIRRATPQHTSRCVHVDGDMAGFVIAGAAGSAGYLQRLAVAPDQRRRGIARALVIDSLCWMRDRQLHSVLVNTGVANGAALELYDGLGFSRMPEHLVIAEYRFVADT